MASGVQNQQWTIYRGENRTIVLTGVDNTNPTGWTLVVSISNFAGQSPPFLQITPTTGGSGPYTISVPLSRANTSLMAQPQYQIDVWRTDSGAYERLAGGQLNVLTPEFPPA